MWIMYSISLELNIHGNKTMATFTIMFISVNSTNNFHFSDIVFTDLSMNILNRTSLHTDMVFAT